MPTKRVKEPAVMRKEASVYKPLGKVAEVTEMPPMKGVTSKMSSEVTSEVTSVATSMAAPIPTESPYMSCWHKNEEGCYTGNNEPFHIPLLRCTRGDNPWRFEVW